VQREGCWVGFAGLAGAAQEVEGEELHLCVWFSLNLSLDIVLFSSRFCIAGLLWRL
jgi:hypothetical protein